MNGSLPSGMLVSALLKRVNDAGGMGMVRARGDAGSGSILLILSGAGVPTKLVERAIGPEGKAALVPAGPGGAGDALACDDYWRRRRARDPDLWVVELDIAGAERFAAEAILDD